MYLVIYEESGPEGGSHEVLGIFSSLQNADHAVEVYVAREHPDAVIELTDDGPDIHYIFKSDGLSFHNEGIDVLFINLDEELTY